MHARPSTAPPLVPPKRERSLRPSLRQLSQRALWLACGLAACTGGISGPDRPSNGGGANGAASEAPVSGASSAALRCEGRPIDPGPSPLRLLSREQYLNTLRDLFGAAGDVQALLASVEEPSAFGLAQGDVSQVELEDFQQAADAVAAKVVSDKALLASIAPCTGADKRTCARNFVQRFGARVYRAPITDATDIERHLKVYDLGAATSHEHGLELLLRALLQAPRFLYQVELGTSERVAENAIELSPYELAARLSFAFWKTLPDEQLIEAANAGKLSSPEGLTHELERMLAHPKGRLALREFLEGLLHLGKVDSLIKDKTLYPEWQDQALRKALTAQAQQFLSYVLEQKDGALAELLTSPTLFVNRELAGFYGTSAGAEFTSIERTDGSVSGILSLPALLAIQAKPNESSPIYRGRFVREVLLCEQLPTPPANIPKPPEVQAGVSTRERMRQHEVDPTCSGCHQRLDPIGFGFEGFDAIGRPRTQDGGKSVDTSGELLLTRDANGKFDGVAELGARLAQSAQVRECVTRQWFRYALARFEQEVDDCTVARMNDAFAARSNSLHALPQALIASDAFLYRRPLDFQEKP